MEFPEIQITDLTLKYIQTSENKTKGVKICSGENLTIKGVCVIVSKSDLFSRSIRDFFSPNFIWEKNETFEAKETKSKWFDYRNLNIFKSCFELCEQKCTETENKKTPTIRECAEHSKNKHMDVEKFEKKWDESSYIDDVESCYDSEEEDKYKYDFLLGKQENDYGTSQINQNEYAKLKNEFIRFEDCGICCLESYHHFLKEKREKNESFQNCENSDSQNLENKEGNFQSNDCFERAYSNLNLFSRKYSYTSYLENFEIEEKNSVSAKYIIKSSFKARSSMGNIKSAHYSLLFNVPYFYNSERTVFDELNYIFILTRGTERVPDLKIFLDLSFSKIDIQSIFGKKIVDLQCDEAFIFEILVNFVSFPKILFAEINFKDKDLESDFMDCLMAISRTTGIIFVFLVKGDLNPFYTCNSYITFENGNLINQTLFADLVDQNGNNIVPYKKLRLSLIDSTAKMGGGLSNILSKDICTENKTAENLHVKNNNLENQKSVEADGESLPQEFDISKTKYSSNLSLNRNSADFNEKTHEKNRIENLQTPCSSIFNEYVETEKINSVLQAYSFPKDNKGFKTIKSFSSKDIRKTQIRCENFECQYLGQSDSEEDNISSELKEFEISQDFAYKRCNNLNKINSVFVFTKTNDSLDVFENQSVEKQLKNTNYHDSSFDKHNIENKLKNGYNLFNEKNENLKKNYCKKNFENSISENRKNTKLTNKKSDSAYHQNFINSKMENQEFVGISSSDSSSSDSSSLQIEKDIPSDNFSEYKKFFVTKNQNTNNKFIKNLENLDETYKEDKLHSHKNNCSSGLSTNKFSKVKFDTSKEKKYPQNFLKRLIPFISNILQKYRCLSKQNILNNVMQHKLYLLNCKFTSLKFFNPVTNLNRQLHIDFFNLQKLRKKGFLKLVFTPFIYYFNIRKSIFLAQRYIRCFLGNKKYRILYISLIFLYFLLNICHENNLCCENDEINFADNKITINNHHDKIIKDSFSNTCIHKEKLKNPAGNEPNISEKHEIEEKKTGKQCVNQNEIPKYFPFLGFKCLQFFGIRINYRECLSFIKITKNHIICKCKPVSNDINTFKIKTVNYTKDKFNISSQNITKNRNNQQFHNCEYFNHQNTFKINSNSHPSHTIIYIANICKNELIPINISKINSLLIWKYKLNTLLIYVIIMFQVISIPNNDYIVARKNMHILFTPNNYLISLLFSTFFLSWLPTIIISLFLANYIPLNILIVSSYFAFITLFIKSHLYAKDKLFIKLMTYIFIIIFMFNVICPMYFEANENSWSVYSRRINPILLARDSDFMEGLIKVKFVGLCLRYCVFVHACMVIFLAKYN
ncbi:hypothetical protein EDEG_01481 [Edhazardia aedis USNM 41457]|uniref:Uncharacterized protein n=1 Tax=Edhazardia aedis (strain USNM 41457) TaxID=1003232 RepID=J9D9R4_EDHAE|nr:hypothetical protein EDEG_01481 [Edhazardia aedis USNM 41457]|eukprot:EJW04249.1 hypothetical protein EDEG_01481 [Edhazardia aedis USNM 41457]